MQEKGAQEAEIDTQALLIETHAALQEGVTELRRQMQLVTEKLEAGHNQQDASHLAFLMEKLARVSSEVRQYDKHELEQIESMTDEEADDVIVAYIRQVPIERRQKFKDAVLTEKASVL